MKLFVANTSKQHQQFLWRSPENPKITPTDIPVGQQRQIGGELTKDVVDSIIAHHARYGMRAAREIKNYRGYVGLAYSVDKPVDMETFYEQEERNSSALDESSQALREETAAVIANQTSETLGTPIKRAEIEIVERTEGTPRVASGVEVVGPGERSKHDGKPGGRNRG